MESVDPVGQLLHGAPATPVPGFEGSPAELLLATGSVFKTFDLQDSGCIAYGVQSHDGRELFIKSATEPEAVPFLRNAIEFMLAVDSPYFPAFHGHVETGKGPVLVYDWFPGEVLHGPDFPGSEGRLDPASPHYRFMHLPYIKRLAVANAVLDLHVQLEELGYVAVDFYDGCILYDFVADDFRFCDFDLYHKGPFPLGRNRNYGSSRFMAPEEFAKGSIIDYRTTVFTMGRTAHVLLAEEWEPQSSLAAVVTKATKLPREDRYQSVSEMWADWVPAMNSGFGN